MVSGNGFNLLSSLQLTELLLFLDEFRDICEWLWLCECDGLESVDRTDDGWSGPASGLGVTVTIGCTEPVMGLFYALAIVFLIKYDTKG